MAFHRQQPPLWIRPRFSRRLAAFVVLAHLAALAAALALPGPWRLAALPVAASLVYQLQVHVLRRAPWSIDGVVWQSDGTWLIHFVSGTQREAQLSPATFVSLPLLVLNLTTGRLRRHSLPLFADALDGEQLRRLRQRLRIEGAGCADGDAVP